jgi:hypothetical protein
MVSLVLLVARTAASSLWKPREAVAFVVGADARLKEGESVDLLFAVRSDP